MQELGSQGADASRMGHPGAAAGTPQRREGGVCPLTCQATASWEISRPDMPSVRRAISEHFFP